MTEIERRFIVTAWDSAVLAGLAIERIEQGYLATPPHVSMSVRISDEAAAWLRPKFGMGVERDDSREHPIALETARYLLDLSCADHLRKHRYRLPVEGTMDRTWEVDLFQDNLAGLVVVEQELPSRDTPVERPSWVHKWTEVTDFLTNQHLARLETELQGVYEERPIHARALDAASTLPMIVLTGGPCSGKSSIMQTLRQEFSDIHFVPEVATILIGQVGIHPPQGDAVAFRWFQKTIFRVQRALEEESLRHALRCAMRAVIMDRGTMDAVAYFPQGMPEFEQVMGVTAASEYARYNQVIHLLPPPAEVYEAECGNNSARTETYEQAIALSDRLHAAWREHPRRQLVSATPHPKDKTDVVRRAILNAL